jgi:hypothetical protein
MVVLCDVDGAGAVVVVVAEHANVAVDIDDVIC